MNSSVGSQVVAATSSVVAATDPTALLNSQLSSALSTLGDAQFWEETISPQTVRNELSTTDPSNPNSTSTLQRGMKWLLASISKGRDVSDFYPHVVKLVGATSLEVRKMVYMYLVQYADHDATTRELSLLSINSFQRGLADHEQLIRGLALRVLSSIRIQDILQIQILGVQKSARDVSPYVRKCAANALAKLSPRCDEMQREMLLDIMKNLLNTESCTMVLTSAIIAFIELCPERLDLIHASFRKICHLLTDMDEWGQVVVIDMLARYCRTFFKEPRAWKGGTAEKIDKERRVIRRTTGIATSTNIDAGLEVLDLTGGGQDSQKLPPHPPRKVKRRVVKKGFYSDEEDSSTEEEVFVDDATGKATSIASTMRQRNILGLPGVQQPVAVNMEAKEDMDLTEDHRLLLDSSMPLLKSRNAGVVLSVCSLHYYCGVSSVKARSAIGKALVRIHRDRREIQYVVLTSIRTLVNECPSAFAPFLHDFFVKALDPPFTRLIKIDILTSLALEPAAIEAVLKELQMYIRSADHKFVCASIRAVGKVVELSRIVYDRHGEKSGDFVKERMTANRIALDCLYGLALATQNCDSCVVVGESIIVMQNIMLILASNTNVAGSHIPVEDPNGVQNFALRRILLLLVNSLSNRIKPVVEEKENSDDEEEEAEASNLEKVAIDLPPSATASALCLVGEWMATVNKSMVTTPGIDGEVKAQMRLEVARLVDRSFPDLDAIEKQQGIHFSSKLLISGTCGTSMLSPTEIVICEHILAMGRVDVNPDVKDRARFESSIIQTTIGLKHDSSAMEASPAIGNVLALENVRQILLEKRPSPSFLPIDDANTVDTTKFRFGTLSNLVGHKARDAYLPLPPWGVINSSKLLRDPADEVVEPHETSESAFIEKKVNSAGFYDSSSSSDSSSESSSSSSDGDSDDASSSSDDSDSKVRFTTSQPAAFPAGGMQDNNLLGFPSLIQTSAPQTPAIQSLVSGDSSSDDDSSSGDSEFSSSKSSSSDDSSYNGDVSNANFSSSQKPSNSMSMQADLLQMGKQQPASTTFTPLQTSNGGASAIDDLRGLVMAPIAVADTTLPDANVDNDSSAWMQLVRPELYSGLAVRARYLRGAAKAREVELAGLDPKNLSILCLQIQFKNKKTDSASLRRVKIVPRSSSKGGIATKKIVCPPEIAELKKGQLSNACVCVQFASASDREGDIVARFDVKASVGGGAPVEIKPHVAELLKPYRITTADFDSFMGKMHGFQRVSASYKIDPSKFESLPKSILKQTALTLVGNVSWENDKLRLVGCLPASDTLVYALIQCDKNNGSGTITTCCDHTMAGNSIFNTLKRAASI